MHDRRQSHVDQRADLLAVVVAPLVEQVQPRTGEPIAAAAAKEGRPASTGRPSRNVEDAGRLRGRSRSP